MTDTTEAPLPKAYTEPINTGGPIAALVPANIEQAFRLSQALALSGEMIPEAYRPRLLDPKDTWTDANNRAGSRIMAAILKGMEVGLAPMQALASIAVINGRPTIWGDAIPALVQRAGHFVDCEIEGEGDARTATATLTRSDGRKVVRRFSVADAKLAKLWGKTGPWTNYPDRMLMMRARMFAARDGASDALMGLQMIEEVADYGPDKARDITPDAPRRGGVIYRETPPAPPPDEIVEQITLAADLTAEQREAEAAAQAEVEERRRRDLEELK